MNLQANPHVNIWDCTKLFRFDDYTRLTVRLIKMQFERITKHGIASHYHLKWSIKNTTKLKKSLRSFEIIFLLFFGSRFLFCLFVCLCFPFYHCSLGRDKMRLFFGASVYKQKYKNVPNDCKKRRRNQNRHVCCIIKWRTKTKREKKLKKTQFRLSVKWKCLYNFKNGHRMKIWWKIDEPKY